MTVVFSGTEAETRELLEAVRRSCSCCLHPNGQPDGSCSAHRLLHDQRALDGLLFVRRDRRAALLQQEHNPVAESDTFGGISHESEDH